MNDYKSFLFYILPWAVFIVFGLMSVLLTKLAKKRKAAAYLLGGFAQCILPDPYAERSIKMVVEAKQEVKKQEDENGKLKIPRANNTE